MLHDARSQQQDFAEGLWQRHRTAWKSLRLSAQQPFCERLRLKVSISSYNVSLESSWWKFRCVDSRFKTPCAD